jgi:hypothetical protein
MADLSLIPQRDGSKNAASSWTSLLHTTELDPPSQDRADGLEACLDLAFAALIWAYTGDDPACLVNARLANAINKQCSPPCLSQR